MNGTISAKQSGARRKHICVAGASGTIGRAVVRALLDDGHAVTALVRPGTDPAAVWDGADICAADLGDRGKGALDAAFEARKFDTVISCIASRSGSAKDAQKVDYRANCHLLNAAEKSGAGHFILLSAICVQRPMLAFQHAKLQFENTLKSSPLDHTIVHPTAFFKSLSGQVERVAKGGKFMVFGDGEMTRCKPISDRDLARFIADCVDNGQRRNVTLPIGGPGPAISPKDQLDILIALLGEERQMRRVPLWIFGAAERVFALGAPLSDWCAEKAEYARIARYYATQSMLVLNPETGEYDAGATPEYGEERLSDHYAELIGGHR